VLVHNLGPKALQFFNRSTVALKIGKYAKSNKDEILA
jgi:hypothetical protein